jgi:subtilisin family serine protease
VINLSLGHAPNESAATDPLAAACRKAIKNGIVVVVAAGNFGQDATGKKVYGGIASPGIEPSVITVGAVSTYNTLTRSDDKIASYSSRGPTIDGMLKPDIAAPGTGIIAPAALGNKLKKKYPKVVYDANYMKLSGTSMATPIVAATVALMLEKNPGLSPNAVKAILMYTAERKGNPLEWGAGYLNSLGAMNLTANINTAVPVSSYWLVNNGSGLKYSNDLYGGYRAVWGGTIIWEDALYSAGQMIKYNQKAFGSTIIWGDTIVWEDLESVFGSTIVWESDLSALSSIISGNTIIWETLDGMNVEETLVDGQ